MQAGPLRHGVPGGRGAASPGDAEGAAGCQGEGIEQERRQQQCYSNNDSSGGGSGANKDDSKSEGNNNGSGCANSRRCEDEGGPRGSKAARDGQQGPQGG